MKRMNNVTGFKGIRFLLFVVLVSVPAFITAQVWVKEKPVPPRSQLKIPPKPEDGLVILSGRWIWDRPARMYVWLSPVWVVPPQGKIWSPGYWKQQREGWIWVPGKWENKKRFWQKNY
jgi:hypothetical protein